MAGGTPVLAGFDAAVRRVDYRDGTTCPAPGSKPQASCPPKGYVEPRVAKRAGSVRARLTVTTGTTRIGKKRVSELRVRFRAPVAITDAKTMYLLEGRVPDSANKRCHHQVVFAPTNQNIARGALVRLAAPIPDDCPGTLRAQVLVADITYHNGTPKPGVVGRITRRLR
jgi:hypothetical protein